MTLSQTSPNSAASHADFGSPTSHSAFKTDIQIKSHDDSAPSSILGGSLHRFLVDGKSEVRSVLSGHRPCQRMEKNRAIPEPDGVDENTPDSWINQ